MRKTVIVLWLGCMALNANAGIYVGPPPSRADIGAPSSARGRSTSAEPTDLDRFWLSALGQRWVGEGDGVMYPFLWSLLLHLLTGSETSPRS